MNPEVAAERPFDVVGFGVNALDLIAIIEGSRAACTRLPEV
jgi:hypothetical protein